MQYLPIFIELQREILTADVSLQQLKSKLNECISVSVKSVTGEHSLGQLNVHEVFKKKKKKKNNNNKKQTKKQVLKIMILLKKNFQLGAESVTTDQEPVEK